MRLIDADALKAKAFGKRGGLIHTSDIDEMPTAQPHDYADGYADGYNQGRKDAQPERKKGWWILVKGSNGKDYHKCSECLHTQEITGVKNYCAVCGAKMEGEADE